MTDHRKPSEPPAPKPPQSHDLPGRPLGLTLIAFPLAVALAAGLVGGFLWLLPSTVSQPPIAPLERRVQSPPPPKLQVDPVVDLVQLRARNAASLEGYRWTDRTQDRAHIPIERAMAILAARGWPDDAGKDGKP